MTFAKFKAFKGFFSTKTILGCLAAVLSVAATSALASSDHVRFSKQVQSFIANDECAKKAANSSASEAFAVIRDMGVDWPDYIEVSEISRDIVNQKTVYRARSGGFAFLFEVLNKEECTLSEGARLLTVQQAVNWQSPSMNILYDLGREYLGEEFFGAANIGGAHTFVVDEYEYNTANHTPLAIVQQYYKEWKNLDVELELQADKSKANVERLLLSLLGVEATDVETARISNKLTKNIVAALEGNESFALVSGSWSAPGVGDPTAGFLAIVATRSGKVLILEQGFVD